MSFLSDVLSRVVRLNYFYAKHFGLADLFYLIDEIQRIVRAFQSMHYVKGSINY